MERINNGINIRYLEFLSFLGKNPPIKYPIPLIAMRTIKPIIKPPIIIKIFSIIQILKRFE